MINKFSDELVVGPDHCLVASAFHRFCEDMGSVIILDDLHIFVAFGGCGW
jgi:hypothetical protein